MGHGPLATSSGGDYFHPWIKSCNGKPQGSCPKKIISHKTIVNSGENAFPRAAFSGLAPTLLVERECHSQPETVGPGLPVGAGESAAPTARDWRECH
jgi:hypothetical protein